MKYREEFEITCHDVDENNHIKPTELIKYLQDTANHQMRDRKPSYYDMFFNNQAFIITRMSVQIYMQLEQYDTIEVSTWRCRDKGATFPRCYQIKRDGDVAVSAYSEWAVVDHTTGRLYRTNEVDTSNYENDEEIMIDIPKRFRMPKDLEMEQVGRHHVCYSDCDMNRHMNNANYSNMLWDRIPGITDKEVTSINIRFMKEAALGSDIDISMGKAAPEIGADPVAEDIFVFKTAVPEGTNVECFMGVRKTEKYIHMQR